MTTFADKLKFWRGAERLSQADAAERIGVSMRTYQEWEQGRAQPHRPNTILLLIDSQPKKARNNASRKKTKAR